MEPQIDRTTLKLIEDVSNEVMRRLRAGEKLFGEKMVHQEFTKYPMLQEHFESITKAVGAGTVTRNELDIDVVAVLGLEESHHVHRHPLGHALASCLGANEGWDEPKSLRYIRAPRITRHSEITDADWIPFVTGDRVLFYPGVPHGLKGSGYILSVQSPSIEGHGGRDDDWDLLP